MKIFLFMVILSLVLPVHAINQLVLPSDGTPGVLAVFPDASSYREYAVQFQKSVQVLREKESTGLLSVTSVPELADTFIDGEYFGRTPIGFRILPGVHHVGLRATDFEDFSTSLNVLSAKSKDLQASLQPLKSAGGQAEFPSGVLRDAIHPTGGFTVEQLIQEKNGRLHAAFRVPFYRDVSFLDNSFEDPLRESSRKTVSASILLEGYGVARSPDGGRSWTVSQKALPSNPVAPIVDETFSVVSPEQGTFLVDDPADLICSPCRTEPVTKTATMYVRTTEFTSRAIIGISAEESGGVSLYYRERKSVTRTPEVIIVSKTPTPPEQFGLFSRSNIIPQGTGLIDLTEFGITEQMIATESSTSNAIFRVLQDGTVQAVSVPLAEGSSPSYSILGRRGRDVYFVERTGTDRLLVSHNGGLQFSDFGPISNPERFALSPQGHAYLLQSEFGADGDSFIVQRLAASGREPVTTVKLAGRIARSFSYAFDSGDNLHVAYEVLLRNSPSTLHYQYVPLAKKKTQAVHLFTEPACAACDVLKAQLGAAGVTFDENPSLSPELQAELDAYFQRAPKPVVVAEDGPDRLFLSGRDMVHLSWSLDASIPLKVDSYPGYPDSWLQVYLGHDGLPGILAHRRTSVLAQYRYRSMNFSRFALTSLVIDNSPPRVLLRGHSLYDSFGRSLTGFDAIRDENDTILLDRFASAPVPLPAFPILNPTQIGSFNFYQIFNAGFPPAGASFTLLDSFVIPTAGTLLAVVGPGSPYVYADLFESKPQSIRFESDRRTLLVTTASDCPERSNCIVFDPVARSVHARLEANAQVVIDDSALGSIVRLTVDPIDDESLLFFRQSRPDDSRVNVTFKFGKDVRPRFSSTDNPAIDGMVYFGDLTALAQDFDLASLLSSSRNTFQSEQQASPLLSEKAYLIMRNKQMGYGVGLKRGPFVTDHELVELLKEAEVIAGLVHGPSFATGIQISKSQWLKAYGSKDTSEAGLNPFSSLIAGGSTSTGVPTKRMEEIDAYFPGWIRDRDGDLINFAHVYAVVALGDLQESDIRNAYRSLGYSYLGDRGFALAYYAGFLFCAVFCQDVSQLAIDNAINEAPLDEVIADFYALSLRPVFRHSDLRLSAGIDSFFGSEAQRSDKAKAIVEVRTLGYPPDLALTG